MNNFDNWIREKTGSQMPAFQPQYWESFQEYRAGQEKVHWINTVAGLLMVLLLLGALTASLKVNQKNDQAPSSDKIAAEIPVDIPDENLSHTTLMDQIANPEATHQYVTPGEGDVNPSSSIENKSLLKTDDLKEVAEKQQSEKNNQSATTPLSQSGFQEIVRSGFSEDFPLDTDDRERFSGRVSLVEMLSGLPIFPLHNGENGPGLNEYMKEYSFYPGPEETKLRWNWHLRGEVLAHPWRAADEKLLTGGFLGVQANVEWNRSWYASLSLGLSHRTGTFGTQVDHPHIVFDFEKHQSGYQIVPTDLFYLQTSVGVGYMCGPWNLFADLGVQQLLQVHGNLNHYELLHSEASEPEFISEKVSSGRIEKSGFKRQVFSLGLGVSCRISDRWTVGLRPTVYLNGLLDKNHNAEFDFSDQRYIPSERSEWAVAEGRFNLGIYLKYNL